LSNFFAGLPLNEFNNLNATLFLYLNRKSKIGKGEAIPLQALTGPDGSRRLRLRDFKTIGT
jgi:hypothetical protein